jgi:hypothetical protein
MAIEFVRLHGVMIVRRMELVIPTIQFLVIRHMIVV